MSDLHTRAIAASISSCSCNTKTPEIKHHSNTCRYRVIKEQAEEIQRLRDALMVAHDYVDCGFTVPSGVLAYWKEISHYESVADAERQKLMEQGNDKAY